jgi:hypothetical protein
MTWARQQEPYFYEKAGFVSYLLKLSNTDYCALSGVVLVYHMRRFGPCLYGGFHGDICFRF